MRGLFTFFPFFDAGHACTSESFLERKNCLQPGIQRGYVPFYFLFACALLLFLTVSATATVVTDDTGATVTIASPPQRIVSLAPSNTEILFALGVGDRVVGVTDYCNYPPEALEIPKVGGYSTVNVEKVIALHPDLVIAAYGNGKELIENLRSFGIPVISLHPANLDDVLDSIVLVGTATGDVESATTLAGELSRRIRAVEMEAEGSDYHPRVAHIIWSDPLYVSGNGTFQDELIRLAGGKNAFSHVEGWKNVGIEDFIAADPEVLIVNKGSGMGGGEDAIAQYFREEPRFGRVSAIRDQRIFLVDSDTVDRAGPRIVDALEQFATDIRSAKGGESDQGERESHGKKMPGFQALAATAACAVVVVFSGGKAKFRDFFSKKGTDSTSGSVMVFVRDGEKAGNSLEKTAKVK